MNALHIAGRTDVGRHRRDNQDTFVGQPLWSGRDALLVVIDGVGGYAGGAEAAAIARDAVVQYMAAPTGDTLTMLREAVVYANNQIVNRRKHDPALARMCCVLTAAVADTDSGRLHYVHVGDTRLYRLREGQLDKLTHDHSLVGVREDANQLTEREAMTHPRRNEILRDVGSTTHRIDDPDFLESGETDFRPGDSLLLCSDGLTDSLTRAQLLTLLDPAVSVADQADALIAEANEQGGQDNITVVLARFPTPTDVLEEGRAAMPPAQIGAPERHQTSDPPANLFRHVPKSPAEPANDPAGGLGGNVPAQDRPQSGRRFREQRTRTGALVAGLVLLLLAGIVWWQLFPPAPVNPTVPAPVAVPPGDSITVPASGSSLSDTIYSTP